MRLMAMQICPQLRNERRVAPATAAPRSAERVTIIGQLPPSSSVSRLMLGHERWIARPVALDPVKAILSTSGCSTSAWPATDPAPVTTPTTPGGMPASTTFAAMASAVKGVISAGLTTIVQPAASAPQSFQPISSAG